MGAFHAYDIRGIYNLDFNKEDVYKIGYFLPGLLNADKVLVGRDVRLSSPEIFDYLVKGITDCGADVYSVGLATTPMIYWGTAKNGFNASVMITASHNTKEYNGLKISRTMALPVGFDNGLNKLQELIHQPIPLSTGMKGKLFEIDYRNEYLDFLKSFAVDLSGLKITVDCSNGMAGLLIRELLGDNPQYLYEELDGTFPNHEANPLDPKNIVDLQKAVIERGNDIGVIFDGDADRVMFVDEKGKFISPDLIIALLGHYFLEEKGEKGIVLQDIRSSKSVGEYLSKLGGEIHTWRVGRAYAALKLRDLEGIYGGELAGHYYFRDFYYSDSAMMACLLVLRVLDKWKKKGKNLSELIASISSYSNSGEINFKINQKFEAMVAVKNHFIETELHTAFYDFDGYRVEFKDWWFNIRPSNTEPYLRLLVEAKNDELLAEKVNIIKNIIANFY